VATAPRPVGPSSFVETIEMTLDELYEAERGRLERRLVRMLGSRMAAEDVAQEAVVRTLQRAPARLRPHEQKAWLHRTATNLAIDELRRRRFTSDVDPDELELTATPEDTTDVLAARDALGALRPPERVVLLLRFELGLSHAEIGAVLDISAEAARKRCERARDRFVAALRGVHSAPKPVIVVAARAGFDRYRNWLERAGAEVKEAAPDLAGFERQLAAADAFVLGGGVTDLHPGLYRERPEVELGAVDPVGDFRHLRLARAALKTDLPVAGICLGYQMLNVALGGSLFQDIYAAGVATQPHVGEPHSVSTLGTSLMRRVVGGRLDHVTSQHHQAPSRLGRGLRVSAAADDGVIEAVELPRRRLTFGVQWHPESEQDSEAGRQLAGALIEAASR
jgi:putative glutamine amidotransferase